MRLRSLRHRGFLTLYLLLGLGVLALLGAGVWYIDRNAVARTERAMVEATAAKQRERTALIAGLAVELGDTKQALYNERQAGARERAAQQAKMEEQLHAYVPSGGQCLRAGFVRYIDAAASGVSLDARPEPGLAAAPAPIGDDAAAATIARNYSKYRACVERHENTLKEFDALRAAHNAAVQRMNGASGTPGTAR